MAAAAGANYALLTASIRGALSTPLAMRRGNRLFGSLFIGAGAALALAGRE